MTVPSDLAPFHAAVVRDVISPAPRDAWHAAIAADPLAMPSQSPEWLDAVCTLSGGSDASRLYDFGNGRHAILPLVRHRVGGLPVVTVGSFPPSWGFGGLLAAGGATSAEVTAVLARVANRPALQTFIRPNPLTAPLWEAAAHAVGPRRMVITPRMAHVLDLSGGFDRVWSERFSSTTRRNVRKAEREGVVIKRDTTGELVPVYYDLYQRSLVRWAEQQNEPRLLALWRGRRRDSEEKLAGLVAATKGLVSLWLAWHNDKPAAGIMVLQGMHNAHYTRGAMDRDIAGPVRANELLHRDAIRAACEAGCLSYQMGETGASESLARFKEGFGATAVPYAEYTLERLPRTTVERGVRELVKKAIGFRDA
jgi:hypothetical protein